MYMQTCVCTYIHAYKHDCVYPKVCPMAATYLSTVEHTRVVLHPEQDVEGSDYINANYITVSEGVRGGGAVKG